MLHQQALILIQAGLKYFFDVDPSLTDHISRNFLNCGTVICWSAESFFRNWSDKATHILSPMLQDLRGLRWGSPEL